MRTMKKFGFKKLLLVNLIEAAIMFLITTCVGEQISIIKKNVAGLNIKVSSS